MTDATKDSKTGFARNVLANWAGQTAMIVSGFLLPRLLSDFLGQAELGVWDFAWTARSFIAMSGLGMGSSSNHYAARFQATDEWGRLSRVLSATLALVIYTAGLSMLVATGVAWFTPHLMPSETAGLVASARVLVMATGFSAAMKMVQNVYGGTIAGLGRFDVLNVVEVVGDVLLISLLFGVLLSGGGLKTMAIVLASQELLRLVGKRCALYHLCPQLRLWPRWTDWERFREIATYGTKTLAETVGAMLLNGMVVAVVMYYHGAAAVALFCRPRALVRTTTRFLMGYARVLVSKAGELQGLGQHAKLSRLLIEGTRHSLYLTLPIAMTLLILGSPVLRLWMGEAYADPTVLTILVLGFLPFQVQRSTYHLLLGIGKHGLAAVTSLVTALISVGLCVLLVGVLQLGLPGAAAAVAIPVGIANLLVIPYIGCRAVGVPLRQYCLESVPGPLVAILPFTAVILTSRLLFAERPLLSLGAGLLPGGLVLLICYWPSAIPNPLKTRLRRWLPCFSPGGAPQQRR